MNRLSPGALLVLLLPSALAARQRSGGQASKQQQHKNVLLLIADDLRPELNKAYGHDYMVTPELDKLAKESLIFDAAFANFAICAASRNSFLSGRMPDKARTWNFIDDFRRSGMSSFGPGVDWTSLPEFFQLQGYYTAGHGKVFHNNRPRRKELRAWNETTKMIKTICPDDFLFCPGSEGDSDADYSDQVTTARAIRVIEEHKDSPWFVAVGFHFPHITWAVPQWTVDEYDLDDIDIADFRFPPYQCPDIAFTAEFDARTEITLDSSQFKSLNTDETAWPVPTPDDNDVPEEVDRLLRLGYYSSVTYTDHLVGQVLDAVKPIKDDTLVIFTSDHGFSLGEQGEWGKHTLFDNSLRIPLIIRAPWFPNSQNKHTRSFFELIDLYRTTIALVGLDTRLIEPDVDGIDQSPLFDNPYQRPLRNAAYAQYSRCPQPRQPEWYNNGCELVPANEISVMGYSVRVKDARFTEWYAFEDCTVNFDKVIATEVYEQQVPDDDDTIDFDSYGMINFADQLHDRVIENARALLRGRFQTDLNYGCPPEQ